LNDVNPERVLQTFAAQMRDGGGVGGGASDQKGKREAKEEFF
jgi:hypothetical protein